MQPPAPPAVAPDTAAWLRIIGSLLVVGTVTELLAHFAGDGTAYAFVLLVILGYSAVGHRLDDVTAFLKSTGIIAG